MSKKCRAYIAPAHNSTISPAKPGCAPTTESSLSNATRALQNAFVRPLIRPRRRALRRPRFDGEIVPAVVNLKPAVLSINGAPISANACVNSCKISCHCPPRRASVKPRKATLSPRRCWQYAERASPGRTGTWLRNCACGLGRHILKLKCRHVHAFWPTQASASKSSYIRLKQGFHVRAT